MDSERFRNEVVRGWAFRNLPKDEKDQIRKYLATGNRTHLPETYRKLAETLRKES